jgi:hypothetical protein
MGKTLLLLTMILTSAAVQANGYRTAKLFKITMINLTKGQPLTPAVVAVHSPAHEIVHLGQAASQGLSELATDGKTDKLVHELKNDMYVVRSMTGKGITLPGQKSEIVVEANDSRFKFTLVSMLARTNDAIIVAKDISTKLKVGQKSVTLASVYDAGVEKNTESCDHIPAPPCNSPGMGEVGEGFVRPHEGVLGLGDLDLSRDAFASVVAKIIVERIQ